MKRSLSRFAAVVSLLAMITLACSLITPGTSSPTTIPPSPSSDGPEYRYDDLPEEGDGDAIIAKYQAVSAWNKLEITYFFINDTGKLDGDTEQNLVRQAFALWAAQTPLTFTEASDRAGADIEIGWASGDHGDGDPFDGRGDVLAHASFPNPYANRRVFLHFDDDERWVNSETQDIDLLTVAAHEIGHSLGLGHSNDPGALMFPSYNGPRRFLGEDDIAGVQSLYGVASAPEPAPNVPPQDATPPPSADQDSDQDGIADQDEVLVTGTDPNNADSDGDGLGDGIEVLNSMNPLDADMDKDGVSDGQEVEQGTDPFFPEQADISPELESQVNQFLTNAIELERLAYRNGDPSVASSIFAGDVYAGLENNIASLNSQGFVQIAEIDYYASYISDIRVISDTHIEADTCEVWTTSIYRASDGGLIQTGGPTLLPQTITIQQLDAGWFITAVEFFDAPSFCR